MIPQKIQALFDFINFVDINKKEFIKKYKPLRDEIKALEKQISLLRPRENYKDKQSFEFLQKDIEEKFETINDNIYKPIKSKLIELEIWSGDDISTSIWNNNISEIEDFKRNFSSEDIKKVFYYKNKYLLFRSETNNDLIFLSFVFSNLDEIYKALFDFFKDTKENEFDTFETKTIEVKDFEGISENLKYNNGKNLKFSNHWETILEKQQTPSKAEKIETNNYNFITMRDKIEIREISENKAGINIGSNNKIEVESNDELSEKSYNWQKWGIIIGTLLTIIGILVAIKYS